MPGTFEIPVIISKNLKNIDGFIALGVLLKEKHHILILFVTLLFSLLNLSTKSKKPIGNGIITV